MSNTLFIIDDSKDQVELMKIIFQQVNSTLVVESALSGEQGLQKLRSNPTQPRVILLDLRMPVKQGIEVLKELKADPRLKGIPVCMFSHGDTTLDINECYETGASFYFTKPVGIEELTKFATTFNSLWFHYASPYESGTSSPNWKSQGETTLY